jgi:hypothetical protein
MDFERVLFIVGQLLGFVAIVLGVLSYQMKTQRGLLMLQVATAAVFVLHYAMIGAISGMALNLVCVVRNIAFYIRHRMGREGKLLPLAFTALTAVVGILTWEAWYSIFIFVALVINAFCMSFSNAQNVRKSILITSPLVMIYDAITRSVGGFIYEGVAIASSVVGILRYRKRKE